MTPDPLEDGRQEFVQFCLENGSQGAIHSLWYWQIWQAAWTARAARERELREALRNIVNTLDLTDEGSHIHAENLKLSRKAYDLAKAALSETQPQEPHANCKYCSEEIKRDGELDWIDRETFSVCRGTKRKHEP